jgi:hypothetical protein
MAIIGVFFSNCSQNLPPEASAWLSVSSHGALGLAPASINLISGQSTTFVASGGKTPYYYAVVTGASTINPSTGVFVAGALAETATVRVTDATGNFATAQAAVKATTRLCVSVAEPNTLTLTCPAGSKVQAIQFASFGTPTGTCGAYKLSTCNAATSSSLVNTLCLNQATCAVGATNLVFGGDPCVGVKKALTVQAVCY